MPNGFRLDEVHLFGPNTEVGIFQIIVHTYDMRQKYTEYDELLNILVNYKLLEINIKLKFSDNFHVAAIKFHVL